MPLPRSASRAFREFGLELPEDVEVRVLESTAERRHLVLPERLTGSEGMCEDCSRYLPNSGAWLVLSASEFFRSARCAERVTLGKSAPANRVGEGRVGIGH